MSNRPREWDFENECVVRYTSKGQVYRPKKPIDDVRPASKQEASCTDEELSRGRVREHVRRGRYGGLGGDASLEEIQNAVLKVMELRKNMSDQHREAFDALVHGWHRSVEDLVDILPRFDRAV